MPRFSDRSSARLAECHPDLQRLAHEAVKIIDFAVIEGYRGEEAQNRAVVEGKSKLRYPHSKHNRTRDGKPCALAMDLAPWKPGVGIDWNDRESFSVMGGVFLALGQQLGIPVRWGGNWDRDAYFRERGDSWDLPHIELDV